jgi:hypothetical protein
MQEPGGDRVWADADLEFPSWSWSGWFDSKNPGKGAGVLYNPNYLDGCFLDLRDWLLNHTWINWHVRDRNDDVRQLWEGPNRPAPSRQVWAGSAASRWQGYKSRGRRGPKWVQHLVAEEHRAGLDDDDYGRPAQSPGRRHVKGPQTSFAKRMPDTPFGVRSAAGEDPPRSYTFSSDGHTASSNNGTQSHKPYQPILAFWTLRCELYILRDEGSAFGTSSPGNGLQKFNIVHRRGVYGDKCGYIVVDKQWAKENNKDGSECTFIALSEAKSFSEEEWAGWTHYVPSAQQDSEWNLFYVMILAQGKQRPVWERVGLGKVFQAAFWNNACVWDEILLG